VAPDDRIQEPKDSQEEFHLPMPIQRLQQSVQEVMQPQGPLQKTHRVQTIQLPHLPPHIQLNW
jgi:hypothetical protein